MTPMADCKESRLTPDDLGPVVDDVVDVSAEWYLLGLQLGVRSATLDRIKLQCSDPKYQLLEMLKTWLKSGNSTSWKTLTHALRSESVGESQLAEKLEKKYCLFEVDRSTTTSDSQPETSVIPPPLSEPVVPTVIPKSGVADIQESEVGEETLTVSLPYYISDSIESQLSSCQSENRGVRVTFDKEKRLLKFTAQDRRLCEEAAKQIEAKAYPSALCFTAEGCRSYHLHISSERNGYPNNLSTSVKMREMHNKSYLQTSEQQRSHYRVEVQGIDEPEVTCCCAMFKRDHRGQLSSLQPWCTYLIHEQLKKLFKALQPLQGHLKFGYEARFGQIYWKLKQSEIEGGLTLGHFQQPSDHFRSRFLPRVANHKNVLAGLKKLEGAKNLIDPLKLYITAQDGKIVTECIGAVKENKDHEFKLKNVFLNQRAKSKGIPQFDIMLPEKHYDVRIAPNFLPAVRQYDSEEYAVVERAVNTLHRSADGTLSMKLKGADYCVKFVRCKRQTLYRWKESEWMLAVYENVMETDDTILQKECQRQQEEPTTIPFKEPKTEIELLHDDSLTKYGPHILSDGHVKHEHQEQSEWNTEEMLKDFDQFLTTSLGMVDLLEPFPVD